MKALTIPGTLLVSLALLLACNEEAAYDGPGFTQMLPEETGVTFSNVLNEAPAFNIFNYLYFYNGGGVATGDLNGDGLPDLYFTANQHDNALYLNQGDFKFKDITELAGVAGKKGWTTGVTMADVNGDGRLDLYVSQLGDYKQISGRNQLYINQGNTAEGIPTFKDEAQAYGLDLRGFATQAAFFDYDRDGDLDMYQLMHSVHSNGTFDRSDLRYETHKLAGDRLLRNDGNIFTDVTDSSGIYSSELGYGLALAIGDVNRDGWPDVYVGNDFHENDYLYINNGDGTFTERLEEMIRHTSRFSMGNDIADFNNDGLPDILSLDMLPRDHEKLKTAAGEDPYDTYHHKLGYGYNYQYARNTLQLNQGNGTFSDIGLMTNTYATDWSWSGLWADLDLDGFKDMVVANGIKRRTTDLDYISYISSEAVQTQLEGDLTEQDLELTRKMPEVKIPNAVFRNTDSLTFQDMSEAWGLNQASFSNGVAYADLDKDGDLDLVMNNLDDPAFIFRNDFIGSGQGVAPHYLRIDFEGTGHNHLGVGAEVKLETAAGMQVYSHYATRGYLSSVAYGLVIGLGETNTVDRLTVTWPTGEQQVLTDIAANQQLVLRQAEAKTPAYAPVPEPKGMLEDVTEEFALDYAHRENKFVEFTREGLMPHMVSTEGPKLAVGDVDGDGDEDFIVGGGKWQSARLFVQDGGQFLYRMQPALVQDSIPEDVDLALVDIDQDQDLDLVVASGGNEWRLGHENTVPRVYRNDGQGNFTRDTAAIPTTVSLHAGSLAVADYDQDGDQDLFLGARSVPYTYGAVPTSFLLRNNGQGQFEDLTEASLPGSGQLGMVKDAHWADMDQDGTLDLVVAAEWEWPKVLLNRGGAFTTIDGPSRSFGHQGWWNTLYPYDVDGDGDLDLLAGNLGLNSKLKASEQEPVQLYVADLDNNGSTDHLLTHYYDGKERLFATKNEITGQLLAVKKRFPQYTEYAQADFEDIIPPGDLRGVLTRKATEFRSGVLINQGDQTFAFRPFPAQGQISPIQAFLPLGRQYGQTEILAGGNFHATNIQLGRYDASYGWLLHIDSTGQAQVLDQDTAGLGWTGEVRDLAFITVGDRQLVLVARNNAPLIIMELLPQLPEGVPLSPSAP